MSLVARRKVQMPHLYPEIHMLLHKIDGDPGVQTSGGVHEPVLEYDVPVQQQWRYVS